MREVASRACEFRSARQRDLALHRRALAADGEAREVGSGRQRFARFSATVPYHLSRSRTVFAREERAHAPPERIEDREADVAGAREREPERRGPAVRRVWERRLEREPRVARHDRNAGVAAEHGAVERREDVVARAAEVAVGGVAGGEEVDLALIG